MLVYFASCFFFIISIAVAAHDEISVNCGSGQIFKADDGREWIGDKHAKISSILQIKGSSSIAGGSSDSADQALFKAARISRTQFSYAFRLNPVPKCIRLHFNPVIYRGFSSSDDLFTVKAGPFILLSNFSASLTAAALGVKPITKEFCMRLAENEPFKVVFSPDHSSSSKAGTYAFINGVEIVSWPAHLSFFHGVVKVVGRNSTVHLDDYNIVLEIVHRQSIRASDDFANMLGMKTDIQKQETDRISNLTWKVSVDVGFRYLIRIHFSKLLGLLMAETNSEIFKIYIDEILADTSIDLVKERDDHGNLKYKDYMTMIQGHRHEGRHHLLISLESCHDFFDRNVPIEGFQVLKLSSLDNNLAGPNPLPPARDPPSKALQILRRACRSENFVVSVAVIAVALVNLIVHKLRQIREGNTGEEQRKLSARAKLLCRRFSLAEMQSATKNFNHESVIGKGGFGKVYKGLIDNGKTFVAIKRLKYSSSQGLPEFWSEIETLSEVRHVNIVSLIGYCSEHEEMILVYEFMTGGTLDDHIHERHINKIQSSSLSWKQRLNICIEAGRGLDYLHTGIGIIHRDVKCSNILLDEKLVAKVSDFGLAKPEDGSTLQSFHSTTIKGTYGYLDPYYFQTREPSRKSDIYAFGVVLLEVFCGRPAFDPKAEEDKCILAKWAREKIIKGKANEVISADLRGQISNDCLNAFLRVVERCLDDDPKKRPSMAQVILQIEFALQQQDNPSSSIAKEIDALDMLPVNDRTNAGKLISSPANKQFGRETVNLESSSGENNVQRHNGGERGELRAPAARGAASPNVLPIEAPVISLVELNRMTDHFGSEALIWEGYLRNVFYATLRNGQPAIIPWLRRFFEPDSSSFVTQVLMVLRLKHEHLMALFGYCLEASDLILVYEFSAMGSLYDVLQGRKRVRGAEPRLVLTWKQRVKIAVGAAKGLEFLLEKCRPSGVYCDVKSANLMLFDDFVSKIDPLGLTFLETETLDGHNAPEFKISQRSVIYSFGVILMELLTGREPVDHTIPDGQQTLVEWVTPRLPEVKQYVDPKLNGKYPPKAAAKMAAIAALCVHAKHELNMFTVVESLQELLW